MIRKLPDPVRATCAVLLLLLLTSCSSGNSPEAVKKEAVSVMGEMGETLSSIKDGETARAAKPALRKLAERMKALKTKWDALPEAKAGEKAAYEKEIQEASAKMSGSMMRLMLVPEAQEVLQDVFKDMDLDEK